MILVLTLYTLNVCIIITNRFIRQQTSEGKPNQYPEGQWDAGIDK